MSSDLLDLQFTLLTSQSTQLYREHSEEHGPRSTFAAIARAASVAFSSKELLDLCYMEDGDSEWNLLMLILPSMFV